MSRRHWGQTREIHNPANEGGIDTRTGPRGTARVLGVESWVQASFVIACRNVWFYMTKLVRSRYSACGGRTRNSLFRAGVSCKACSSARGEDKHSSGRLDAHVQERVLLTAV